MNKRFSHLLSPALLCIISSVGCGDLEKGIVVEIHQAPNGSGGSGQAATTGQTKPSQQTTPTQQTATGGGPSGGAGGVPSTGGVSTGGTPVASDILVDDFEDGNDLPLISGSWYSYTDQSNGGLSTIAFPGASAGGIVMSGEGYASQRSLQVDYTFDQGTLSYAPFVGLGVSVGDATNPLDLGVYAGITYQYRGGAHRARLEIATVADYDFHGVDLPASDQWTTVTLDFKGFAQEGWGQRVAFTPSQTTAIDFQMRGTTGETKTLLIDNLKVLATLPVAAPDMVIRPPAPPADAVLEPVAITNPLQAKAQAYLSKGYNITNWLEQDRFSGFTYDESTVQKLALAGFKSLRLPIDLDRYADARTGSGSSLSFSVNGDLFTILDAFDGWTKTHGMSLTIDYHQYDASLSMADPDSLTLAVQLWGKVAEHFAANPREDIFFELLNEPELSFSGTPPTQAEWTALAERMIGAIRAHDTRHTLLFGDVEWNGITPLAQRAPLTDQNVVYVFHDYEPFIFTHQGAEWANMASTHDIPYPYTPDRWSEYYVDLGFSKFMDSWILSSVQDYYQTGNRSALRNRMVEVKRWAIANNVPVICNEFGANDRTSRLEDRARYLTDVVSIFDELAIPWQHWWMIMDSNGVVIPEYRTAMRLGT